MNSKNTMKKNKKLSVKKMTLISIFASLMCISSWITIPSPFNPTVPFTLQTLSVILTGLILSPSEAGFASLVYLMLGIVGLPVFSGFGTLYSKLFTATGGYLIGIFIAPFFISLLCKAIFKSIDKHQTKQIISKALHFTVYLVLAITVGIPIIDIPGIIVGKFITNADWVSAVTLFSLAFLPTDILKCIVAAILASALEKPLSIIKNN